MQRALVLAAIWSAPIIAPVSTVSAALSLGSVAPAPVSAFAAQRADAASRKIDHVVIPTSDDLKLTGTYYPPRSRSGRAPAALLVHDAGADRGQMDSIAARLQKTGFGVLTIDLRGHGESKSRRVDWTALDSDGQESLWALAPRDVEASARWLLKQKGVHSTSLSLVGYRAGCALVARHAEQDENVIGMMLLSPKEKDLGFDVKGTMRNVNGLPTCVVDQKNEATTRLISEANALTPTPWVDHVLIPSKQPSVLDDSKTPSKVSSWLGDIALPKKGR